MRLCTLCQKFDIQFFCNDNDGIRSSRLQALVDGQAKGCEFCSILFDHLAPDIDKLLTNVTHVSDSDGNGWMHISLYADQERLSKKKPVRGITALIAWLTLDRPPIPKDGDSLQPWRDVPKPSDPIRLSVAADISSLAARTGWINGRVLGKNTGSRAHIQAIKEWLERCKSHPRCAKSLSGKAFSNVVNTASSSADIELCSIDVELPMRCVRVTGKARELVKTHGKRGTYLILSHRWAANTKSCRTTAENLESRLRNGLQNLTQTFNDAVELTYKLGYEYLWIDSLCIVQDGDGGADWLAESAQMANYYQNAALTICAATETPENGLFTQREYPFTKIAKLPFHCGTNENKIHRSTKGYLYISNRPTDWHAQFRRDVIQGSLLKRGWIFQEWILSRRIVYFTNSQIYFECASKGPRSEAGEDVYLSQLKSSKLVHRFSKSVFSDTDRPFQELWYSAIAGYSKTQLTYPAKDRLQAVAGLASEFLESFALSTMQDPIHHNYLAGLWRKDIHQGLLWERKHALDDYVPLKDFPTWSWASLQNEICWPRWENSTKVEAAFTVTQLVDASRKCEITQFGDYVCQSAAPRGSHAVLGSSDIGTLTTAIKVKGRLISLLLREDFRTVDYRFLRQATGYCSGDLTDANDGARTNYGWHKVCSQAESDIIAGWACLDCPTQVLQADKATSVYAFHVSVYRNGIGGLAFGTFGLNHSVYGILLVSRNEHGEYTRLGVGRVFEKRIIEEFDSTEPQEIELR